MVCILHPTGYLTDFNKQGAWVISEILASHGGEVVNHSLLGCDVV